MKKPLVIAGGVVGAAALLYLESAFLFLGRFPFRTYVDGEDVSMQTVGEAAATMQTAASRYALTITGRNGVTDTIAADDINMTVDATSELASDIHKRSVLAWPLSLLQDTHYTTSTETEFSRDRLEEVVSSLAFYDTENEIAPTDAYYELVDGTYTLISEEQGALLDQERTLSEIALAIANGDETLDLDAAGCYQTPQITTEDEALSADVETLNSFIAMEIHIPIGGGDGENIDAATIATWIVAEEDYAAGLEAAGDATDNAAAAAAAAMSTDANNGGSGLPSGFTFDTDKIAAYVETLAEQYNTYGETHSITTQHGSTYASAAGSYGWWLNKDSTAAAILAALNSGVGGEVEPVYYQRAAQWPTEANGNNDIGSTYAEVDLDNQHMYFIQDGKVVFESDFVSGKATYERMTPDGFYRLTFKQLDATLKGEDYETPVKYWMPFNRGIGFHDANWRSNFGGKIYLTNGSHGCINLPPAKAAQLYNYVYAGVPVIVYGGMTPSQASSYVANGGSTAGASSSAGSSAASATETTNGDAATDANGAGDGANTNQADTAAQDAANAAAASQQVTDAASQIASQIYEQQINAGASAEEALAAAQAAAQAAVSAAGQ